MAARSPIILTWKAEMTSKMPSTMSQMPATQTKISTGDAATGGYGVAAVVTGIPGVESVVGVVMLSEPDEARIGPLVARAAADITRSLS